MELNATSTLHRLSHMKDEAKRSTGDGVWRIILGDPGRMTKNIQLRRGGGRRHSQIWKVVLPKSNKDSFGNKVAILTSGGRADKGIKHRPLAGAWI